METHFIDIRFFLSYIRIFLLNLSVYHSPNTSFDFSNALVHFREDDNEQDNYLNGLLACLWEKELKKNPVKWLRFLKEKEFPTCLAPGYRIDIQRSATELLRQMLAATALYLFSEDEALKLKVERIFFQLRYSMAFFLGYLSAFGTESKALARAGGDARKRKVEENAEKIFRELVQKGDRRGAKFLIERPDWDNIVDGVFDTKTGVAPATNRKYRNIMERRLSEKYKEKITLTFI